MDHVAPSTLVIIREFAVHFGRPVTEFDEALKQFDGSERISVESVASLGRMAGLDVTFRTCTWPEIGYRIEAFPCLAFAKDGTPAVIAGYKTAEQMSEAGGQAADVVLMAVRDPQTGQVRHSPVERAPFEERWSGLIAVVTPQSEEQDDKGFGLSWFVSQLGSRPGLLAQIVFVVLVLHGLALAVPLFFQAIVDRVLVHETIMTLNTLTIGVMVILVFDAVLRFLRDYLIGFLGAKIDVRAATTTFKQLARLPLAYFQRTTAGVIANNMLQADRIRDFVTGRVLTLGIEVTAILVFLPVLCLYSWKLALVVVGTSLLMGLLIWLLTKPYTNILNRLYAIEGARKTHLVETIHGVGTIKSLALETGRIQSWNGLSAQAASFGFSLKRLSALGGSLMRFLEQISGVAVLFLGAHMVLQHELTLGALVAFRMLAGNVTGPILRLAETMHEYQRAGLAARMLGAVMDEPVERTSARALSLPIRGAIRFDEVTFTYPGASVPALQQVSFEIRPGEVIGVVGRSGSGKSTLARLIQGLHSPDQGWIEIDGRDLRDFDLKHLRQSIGVVLQENFLFRGTIAANIAMTEPRATLPFIQHVAQLAGAHDFIRDLPSGYETIIEENGANLSGGQRQRIAIARALLRDPPVLIFDEATSALDVETETIIQNNLAEIARGRTVILIAHRLSTLRDAHRIMVVDKGRVIDFRPHEDLLDPNDGCPLYQAIWRQQVHNATGRETTGRRGPQAREREATDA